MDVRLQEIAARQDDLVASWQLIAAGWTERMVRHHSRQGNWRRVHRGVYLLAQGEPTRHQRWLAATLTAPRTYLSHASAGACEGFFAFDGSFEVVTRCGSGGRRRMGALLVCRSTTLDGHTTTKDGIPITTPERTLIDLAAHLDDTQLRRAFRESIRLKTTTTPKIAAAATSSSRGRGTARLLELAQRYEHVPYSRTRSDAEGNALERLLDARAERPRVNVRIAGKEADLVFDDRKEILEIDGPQYHGFPEEHARKAARWQGAGYTVWRVRSDDVYLSPP
ncbi:MAG TPA: type IV toxin-antitoxin system AbiEi family antitoxin domain-containing protein [Thermoleophilaceae bacterium]|nr:type IV toxin-antitoxin system AbiEi family antitoxin domain-containing protein [Thermoleophilaceae bacterium]